jgi:hypothetical protein
MTYPLLQCGRDRYVAVNTNALPRYLRQKFSHPLDDDQWRHIHIPGPAITAFPQLPFVLINLPFASCRLLGPLSRGYVRRYKEDSFGMETKTCVQWKQLETDLVNIIKHLCHYAKTVNNVVFPPAFDPTCTSLLPSAFRYDERLARRYDITKRASLAFELLIATVSFAIGCATRENDDPGHPAW